MSLPRLKLAALAMCVAVLATAGCNSDQALVSDNPNAAIIGSGRQFVLSAVNGRPLPAVLRNDASGSLSVLEGTLSFGPGTFLQTLTLSETMPAGSATTRDATAQGTVVLNGDRLLFHASDGGEWEGVISGNRIDYAVPGNNGSVGFTFVRN
jgi:hypothetical protein